MDRRGTDEHQDLCVHCDDAPGDTRDHLIPKAWYPDSTPPDVERLSFPSCSPCNAKYGRIEEDLLIKFGMCLAPDDARARGIPDRVLRAIDGSRGRDDRDRRAREGRLARLTESVEIESRQPSEGVLPGFGELADVEYDQYVTIGVEVEALAAMVRKFAKGTAYLHSGRRIPATHIIEWRPAEELDREIELLFECYGIVDERGPGVHIRRAAVPPDETQSMSWIDLWGRLRLYVVVRSGLPASHGNDWLRA